MSNVGWIKDTSQFNEELLKNYNEASDEGYFLQNDVQYPQKMHDLHNDLPFRLKNSNLGANLGNKTEYVIHIKILKQASTHSLVLKKVNRGIKLNQNAWLKPYIDMNTNLTKKANNDFKKDFFKLMNNVVFEKNMENVTRNRDIKLVTPERRRNYLVS